MAKGETALAVGALLGNDDLLIPAGVYSFFMFFHGRIFARFMSRRNASEQQVSQARVRRILVDSPNGRWE
ncbi:MAG: hypothetical protein ACSLFI_08215 [Solirubrobacterales bacterium]